MGRDGGTEGRRNEEKWSKKKNERGAQAQAQADTKIKKEKFQSASIITEKLLLFLFPKVRKGDKERSIPG